eukprot:58799-Chlamydomonas_euryale.AAC.1
MARQAKNLDTDMPEPCLIAAQTLEPRWQAARRLCWAAHAHQQQHSIRFERNCNHASWLSPVIKHQRGTCPAPNKGIMLCPEGVQLSPSPVSMHSAPHTCGCTCDGAIARAATDVTANVAPFQLAGGCHASGGHRVGQGEFLALGPIGCGWASLANAGR